MLQILLHSSKTMVSTTTTSHTPLDSPRHLARAMELVAMWRRAEHKALEQYMKLSPKKATEVAQMFAQWSPTPDHQLPAIDAFRGDIYSGLQASTWSDTDRQYAHHTLIILSGLYGALRACDGIMPYRLEMGYKLPDGRSLYKYWGSSLASSLPDDTSHLLNLSAVEYTKAILPFTTLPVTTPKFLTIHPTTGRPTFVVVHAKIARGAFASWAIRQRITDTSQLLAFDELGYTYSHTLSTPDVPVFVCQTFQGTGLSIRTKKEKA